MQGPRHPRLDILLDCTLYRLAANSIWSCNVMHGRLWHCKYARRAFAATSGDNIGDRRSTTLTAGLLLGWSPPQKFQELQQLLYGDECQFRPDGPGDRGRPCLKANLYRAGITPLFVLTNGAFLTHGAVSKTLRESLRDLGLNDRAYAPHPFRIGGTADSGVLSRCLQTAGESHGGQRYLPRLYGTAVAPLWTPRPLVVLQQAANGGMHSPGVKTERSSSRDPQVVDRTFRRLPARCCS